MGPWVSTSSFRSLRTLASGGNQKVGTLSIPTLRSATSLTWYSIPSLCNPTGVAAVFGTTFTGEFEDVEAIDAMICA